MLQRHFTTAIFLLLAVAAIAQNGNWSDAQYRDRYWAKDYANSSSNLNAPHICNYRNGKK